MENFALLARDPFDKSPRPRSKKSPKNKQKFDKGCRAFLVIVPMFDRTRRKINVVLCSKMEAKYFFGLSTLTPDYERGGAWPRKFFNRVQYRLHPWEGSHTHTMPDCRPHCFCPDSFDLLQTSSAKWALTR